MPEPVSVHDFPEIRWRGRWIWVPEESIEVSGWVRSWTGGNEGEYSEQKIHNQLRGVYTIDWDTEREVVLAEPFMSYVVHDAVAQAGKADLLPDLYPRWSEFLVDGYDTPRLGRLSFARGSVPSPHGVVTVEASRAHLAIDSPVPIVLDLPDQPERRLTAGRHELTSETLTNVDARLSVAPAR